MEHNQHGLAHAFSRQLLPGLTGLYLHSILRDLGRGFVNIFIPIYIYQLTGSILYPFLAYAFYHFLVVIFSPFSAYFINKLGTDWSFALGALFRVFSIIFLIFAQTQPFYIIGTMVCWGILVPFSWIPHHYTVMQADGGDHKFGKIGSIVLGIQQLANAVAPVLGGLIILFLDYRALYLTAIIFILLSMIPVFFDKYENKDMRLSYKRLFTGIFDKKHRRLNLGLVGESLEGGLISLLWPLFIFLFVGQVYKVGAVTSAALLVSLGLLLYFGRYTDKKGRAWSAKMFWAIIIIWLIRFFVRNALGFVIIDSAYYIIASLTFFTYLTFVYEKVVQRHKLEFLVRREIILHMVAALLCLVVGLSIYLFDAWWPGFVLPAIGAWLMKKAVFNHKK